MLEYYNMYQSRRELLDYEKCMREMKTGFNFSKEKETTSEENSVVQKENEKKD